MMPEQGVTAYREPVLLREIDDHVRAGEVEAGRRRPGPLPFELVLGDDQAALRGDEIVVTGIAERAVARADRRAEAAAVPAREKAVSRIAPL